MRGALTQSEVPLAAALREGREVDGDGGGGGGAHGSVYKWE